MAFSCPKPTFTRKGVLKIEGVPSCKVEKRNPGNPYPWSHTAVRNQFFCRPEDLHPPMARRLPFSKIFKKLSLHWGGLRNRKNFQFRSENEDRRGSKNFIGIVSCQCRGLLKIGSLKIWGGRDIFAILAKACFKV